MNEHASISEVVGIHDRLHPGSMRRVLRDGFIRIMVFLGLLPLMILGFIGIYNHFEEEPWTPLGPYPQQQIIDSRPIRLSQGTVSSVGTKCSEPNTPLEGVTRWISISPGGATVEVGRGSTVRNGPRAAGTQIIRDEATGRPCEVRSFENEIPDEVDQKTREWISDEIRVVWSITGVETPVDGSRKGVPITWTTEPFEVVVG